MRRVALSSWYFVFISIACNVSEFYAQEGGVLGLSVEKHHTERRERRKHFSFKLGKGFSFLKSKKKQSLVRKIGQQSCKKDNVLKNKFFLDDLQESFLHPLGPRRYTPASLKEKDSLGRTRLHAAVIKNDREYLTEMISEGAEPDVVDDRELAPLHYACFVGDIKTVKVLLKAGASCAVISSEGYTPVHVAVEAGHLEILQQLSINDTQCKEMIKDGSTILHCAARSGSSKVIARVLEQININLLANSANDCGAYPIHDAVKHGDKACISLLLKNGAHIDVVDNEGKSPFYHACARGDLEIIEYLLTHKPSLSDAYDGSTILHAVCSSGSLEALTCVHDLVGKSAYETPDMHGFLPLHDAVLSGSLKCVKKLAGSFNIKEMCNAETDQGETPFYLAVRNGHLKIAKFLHKNGADVQKKRDCGCSILHAACYSESLECVQYILRLTGTSLLEDVSNWYWSPIHAAVGSDKLEIVEELVKEQHVSIEVRNQDGYTPFLAALQEGYLEIAQFLEKSGADINAESSFGVTRVHAACESGSPDTLRYVLGPENSMRPFKQKTLEGWNALHYAASGGDLTCVKELVEQHDLNCNASEDHGWTPLFIALREGHIHVARYLQKRGVDWYVRTNDGCTALHAACMSGSLSCVRLVLEHLKDESLLTACNQNGMNALQIVVREGSLPCVKELIEQHGFNCNTPGNNSWTPLLIALEKGHMHVVRYLHEMGVDWNVKTDDGCTTIHAACFSGSVAAVRFVLDITNDESLLFQCDQGGWNALHIAAQEGSLPCVKELVEQHGFDCDVPLNDGRTPLFCALNKGHTHVARYLHEKGADWNIIATDGSTPLMAACNSDSLAAVRMVFEHCTNESLLTVCTSDGWNALHSAAFEGSLSCVRELIEQRDFDCNVSTNNGWTPLFLALSKGHMHVVRYLREIGVNWSIKTDDGTTMLHAACQSDSVAAVRFVLDISNDKSLLTACTQDGWTALHVAVQEGSLSCVAELVEQHSVPVDSVTSSGMTPFHLALDKGYLAIARYLQNKGASVEAVDEDKRTCVHRACDLGSLETLRYTLQCLGRECLEKRDLKGFTPLHLAAYFGSLPCVKELISQGAQKNVVCIEGYTPLHLACQKGHLDITEYLISQGASAGMTTPDGETIKTLAQVSGSRECVKFVTQLLNGLRFEGNANDLELLEQEIILMQREIQKCGRYDQKDDLLTKGTYNREKVYGELKQLLLQAFPTTSKLFAIPNVDIITYKRVIQILYNKLQYENCPEDVLLSLWSFVVGIPIIGLEESGDYYKNNVHLCKLNQSETLPVLKYAYNTIQVNSENNSQQLLKVPIELKESAVFYRSSLGKVRLVNPVEQPCIVWDFIQDGVVPLSDFIGTPQARSLLNVLFRIHDGEPCYTLGMTSLLRNTAIYLSKQSGKSRVIVSPCSVEAVNYLGLQDGIFIENAQNLESVIDYYFGVNFYRRACLTCYDSARSTSLQRCDYYPHFGLGQSTNDQLAKMNVADRRFPALFAIKFSRLVQGTSEEEADSLSKAIVSIISDIDEQQLKVPVLAGVHQKNSEDVLIEPYRIVDLSGELKDEYSDEERFPINGVPLLLLSNLIKQLYWFDNQQIRKLDLSDNAITHEGASDLAEALSDNIVPQLEELNLLYNALDEKIITPYIPVLRRYYFKKLLLGLSIAEKQMNLPSILIKKIV